jgi:hypothetical protein
MSQESRGNGHTFLLDAKRAQNRITFIEIRLAAIRIEAP